jgi:hypothetical protein
VNTQEDRSGYSQIANLASKKKNVEPRKDSGIIMKAGGESTLEIE